MADKQQEKATDFRYVEYDEDILISGNYIAFVVLVFLLALFASFRILALREIGVENPETNELGFITNVVTEGLSIFVTLFFFERIQRSQDRSRDRQERQLQEEIALKQIKKQLLIDVKYGTNEAAINAINRMRGYDDEYGWLTSENGLLVGERLNGAKLQNAKLKGANLSKTIMEEVNLQSAELTSCKFSGAVLRKVNLRQADLSNLDLSGIDFTECDFEGAKLFKSNLEDANLSYANLSKTDLAGANMSGARLYMATMGGAILERMDDSLGFDNETFEQAIFSDDTVLPDAEVVGLDGFDNEVFDKYFETYLGIEQMEKYTGQELSKDHFTNPGSPF